MGSNPYQPDYGQSNIAPSTPQNAPMGRAAFEQFLSEDDAPSAPASNPYQFRDDDAWYASAFILDEYGSTEGFSIIPGEVRDRQGPNYQNVGDFLATLGQDPDEIERWQDRLIAAGYTGLEKSTTRQLGLDSDTVAALADAIHIAQGMQISLDELLKRREAANDALHGKTGRAEARSSIFNKADSASIGELIKDVFIEAKGRGPTKKELAAFEAKYRGFEVQVYGQQRGVESYIQGVTEGTGTATGYTVTGPSSTADQGAVAATFRDHIAPALEQDAEGGAYRFLQTFDSFSKMLGRRV